jgi:hypothetical protein
LVCRDLAARKEKEAAMKNSVRVLLIALFAIPLIGTAAQQEKGKEGPLPWAYGADAPPAAPAAPPAQADMSLKHVPGSNLSFTLPQIRDTFGPADWHPGDHGAMPDIVAHGKKPDVLACALCHYPNGKGRAENAGVSGLPVAYFMQQSVFEFRPHGQGKLAVKKGYLVLHKPTVNLISLVMWQKIDRRHELSNIGGAHASA